MSQFFTKLRQIVVAGFFFLFPLYVVFVVISKAWTSLTSIGSKLASMFGVKSVIGVGGTTLFTSLAIVAMTSLWTTGACFIRQRIQQGLGADDFWPYSGVCNLPGHS